MFPCLKLDSSVNGEELLSNSITVPTGISALTGLLRVIVVLPPAVRIFWIVVFGCIPDTLDFIS